jgi:hypothetical protein
MSQMGHKQTFRIARALSALPPKADMCGALAYVCFGPIADIAVLHSITSSARSRMLGGTVSPMADAVLRLTINSKAVAC